MSIFTSVAFRRPKSSTFNLTHQRKFSMDMGLLTPILCQETLPGDKWNISTQQILRLQPMLTPMMHDVNVTIHFFKVPNRILWKNWEDFITGGKSGLDMHLKPTVNLDQCCYNDGTQAGKMNYKLADYLGLPAKPYMTDIERSKFNGEKIDILPFLAYQKIYNEFYRDQNLQEDLDEDLFNNINDGDNSSLLGFSPMLFSLRRRAWNHDYFTSCLPFAQKGQAVKLPLGGTAPLITIDGSTRINTADGDPLTTSGDLVNNLSNLQSGSYLGAQADVTEHTLADLSNATSATVTDLRRAFKLQEWLEKNARAGSRYVEMLLAHFGIRSSDGRLQRPEFLGGSTSPIMISEVLQTSQTDTSPQGNMSGHGLNLGNGGTISTFCEEHGWIIGIMSVTPKLS